MGRKRWWRGGLELFVLCILHHAVLGDGNVGCLFSKNLCNSGTETCYNDLAFGKCIPIYADLDSEDLYQYDLDTEELEFLRLQLERLENEGYKWPHPYTQCIMQMSLHNFRNGLKQDFRLCHHLKEHNGHRSRIRDDITDANIQTVLENVPQNIVTGELYFLPAIENEYVRPVPQDKEFLDAPYSERTREALQLYNPKYVLDPYNNYDSPASGGSLYNSGKMLRKKALIVNENGENYELRVPGSYWNARNDENDDDDDTISLQDALNNRLEELDEAPRVKILVDDSLDYSSSVERNNEETFEQSPGADSNEEYERIFSRKYKHPKRAPSLEFLEQEDDSDRDGWSKSEKDESYGGGNQDGGEDSERPTIDLSSSENGLYTEGGLVQPLRYDARQSDSEAEDNEYEPLFDRDLDALLWRRELAGFKRRERLDVKKPGPLFSMNNYAFRTQPPAVLEDSSSEESQQNAVFVAPLVKKKLDKDLNELEVSTRSYKNVDLDHVYIVFKNEFHTWAEGDRVVKEVSKLLGLAPGTLTDVRVGRAEVTFKVVRNKKNYNATDVVNSIGDKQGKLREALGVEILRAGIGDKTKLPAMVEVARESEMSSSLFGAIVAAGVAAAVAAAVVTLIIARRHAKSRAKLAGLATPDPEASKDYQDLCRARMQAKQPTDKAESPRVTNLSREGDGNNTPSNRSSTSSWSEEPALSNMDISTGHMVLSYMEDHLKNKDRLDQEWAALCAYEADPSSTEIAELDENKKYNRPDAALPYDHSRLVLNELANANGTDYINASTITDHDPRNPAYIATQGPLPQTTADFWQLVWEQGSVVIVMLTRLTEEGRAMCHRYWPDEGSELYHIYEVHLVSEHFWCDDYLVRSFYLKNLRTGETRTVTQFHFLSWPENSVPHSTKALLEFRRKVNKSYRGRSCPIVVHCSDGAGRTGTYCLIDMVLNRMAKGAKEIDIAATLEHIRDQRPDMVATKQQFEFVLMAVAEEVHAILKALPVPPPEKFTTSPSGSSASQGKCDQ